jgi:ribosomal protein L7Ae-like RNA K-turn-binding protein
LDNSRKILNFLGIARKAGCISPGEFMTEKCVKTGKAHLVILSSEASENTKKAFHGLCARCRVPVFDFGEKEALGRAIGKNFAAALAVTDERFGAQLINLLRENGGIEYESE